MVSKYDERMKEKESATEKKTNRCIKKSIIQVSSGSTVPRCEQMTKVASEDMQLVSSD